MSQHLPAFRLPHLSAGCNGRNLKLLNHPVPDLGLSFHPDPSPGNAAPTPAPGEASCTEPLLKAATPGSTPATGTGTGTTPYRLAATGTGTGMGTTPYRLAAAGGQPAPRVATDSLAKRSASVESDSLSSKGSNSSLEPLLPQESQSGRGFESSDSGSFVFGGTRRDPRGGRGVCGEVEVWDPSFPPTSAAASAAEEKKVLLEGERVRLPPLGHHHHHQHQRSGDHRVVSMSSLSTLEENDEVSACDEGGQNSL